MTSEHLLHDVRGGLFAQVFGRHYLVEQFAASAQLHDQVDVLVVLERLEQTWREIEWSEYLILRS